MKTSKTTKREPSPANDRQTAIMAALLLIAVCIMWACSDMTEDVEQEMQAVINDDEEMIGEIIILEGEEAVLFEQAVEEFTSRVYAKDGQLHLRPAPKGSPPESPWHYLFLQGLHTANEMIRTGEASLEELSTPRTYHYEAETKTESSKSYVPGDTPPDAANPQPPGDWDYSYSGGGLHSIYLSHEAYHYFLWGVGSAASFASLAGVPASVSATILAVIGFSKLHYDFRGKGGGIRIYIWNVGGLIFTRIIYPDPPPDADAS